MQFNIEAILQSKRQRMICAYVFLASWAYSGCMENRVYTKGDIKRMFGYYSASDYTTIPDEYKPCIPFYDDFAYWYEARNESNDYSTMLREVSLEYGFPSLKEAEKQYLIIKEAAAFESADFEAKVITPTLEALNESGMIRIYPQMTETNGNAKHKTIIEEKLFKRNKDTEYTRINGILVRKVLSYSIKYELLAF